MPRLKLKDGADFAAYWALARLPTGACSALGAYGAHVRGPNSYPQADRRAAENMRRLAPHLSAEALAAACTRRWDNIGRLMAEYAVLHRLIPEGRIGIEGAQHLEAAKATGRGVVLLGLHLGNWEVYTPALVALGLKPATFYDPQPSFARDYISSAVRRRLGAALFPPNLQGARMALDHLRGGGAVALFADESVGGVVRGPFLGRAPHTHGNLRYAVQFARSTGALIVPGFVQRVDGAHFLGRCLEPIELPPEPTPGARRLEDILLLNGVMEPLVLQHLDQWYFLHDRLG